MRQPTFCPFCGKYDVLQNFTGSKFPGAWLECRSCLEIFKIQPLADLEEPVEDY